MDNSDRPAWAAWPPRSGAAPYGLALISVATAVGLAYVFLYFHLPQPFAGFALCAIAITFWYGGTSPGILATLLSALVRTFFFDPAVDIIARIVYDLVFVSFAALMVQATRARNELEVRVAERTAALDHANEDLRLEIAERTRAEEKLRQSEAYLAEAQTLSHAGSWAWNVATRDLTHSSEEWRRIHGLDQDGVPPSWEQRIQRIHPLDRDRFVEATETAIRRKTGYELDCRIVRPSGETRDIHIVSHPVLDPSGDVIEFVGTAIDITERAKAEAELLESQAYLAEAQRLTHTGSFAFNIATRKIVHWSLEHFRLFGYDPEAGLPSFEAVAARIHPDDRAGFAAVWERAIREAADVDQECRIVLQDGTIKYIHGVGHPVFNAAGDLDRLVGTVVDVTELRRADEERERLRQAQADLAHVSRVTTMGELTASLAHEVTQPIAAAVTDANTCLRWLQRDTPDVQEAREAASRVLKDATRAVDIISRIRLLFKKGTPQREPVDVNDVVREMVVLLRGEAARHSVSVRTELAEDVPPVLGDRVQIQQVMMNLIINSIDAMKDVDGTRELVITSRPANEQLIVSVSDTGVGVPAQHVDRIFQTFFTTKDHGTGMGLSISRSIVESHGGRLWAAGSSPRGASFHLTLPVLGRDPSMSSQPLPGHTKG